MNIAVAFFLAMTAFSAGKALLRTGVIALACWNKDVGTLVSIILFGET